MRNLTEAERRRLRDAFLGNFLLLLFGCGVLGYLVAIDRVDWFSIHPATGSSIAMARSAQANEAAGTTLAPANTEKEDDEAR